MAKQEGSFKFEEFRQIGRGASWAILIIFCLLILFWGLIIYHAIPEPPRHWDFGILPDTPADSIYSTERPPPAQPTPPAQIPRPPEARTYEPPGGKP